MKKLFFVFVALFTCVGMSYSQVEKTNKEIKKEFLRQREFALDVDLSNTVFAGMNSDDFVAYMSMKENITKEALQIVLNKYKSSFYVGNTKYKFVDDKNGDMPYRIHIKVKSISEKAGIKANAIVTYKDSVDIASIDLPVEDGRWNTFAVLLEENAEKQCRELDVALRRKALDNYYVQSKATFKYIMKW